MMHQFISPHTDLAFVEDRRRRFERRAADHRLARTLRANGRRHRRSDTHADHQPSTPLTVTACCAV